MSRKRIYNRVIGDRNDYSPLGELLTDKELERMCLRNSRRDWPNTAKAAVKTEKKMYFFCGVRFADSYELVKQEKSLTLKTINKMLRIKRESKAGQNFWARYESAEATSVTQFYKRPSDAKISAEKECLRTMGREHGKDYKILGGNTSRFTAAWETAEGLRVETGMNSYLIF